MNADTLITWALHQPDPTLTALLSECAQHQANPVFSLTEKEVTTADVLLFSVNDAASLQRARDTALKLQDTAPSQARLLVVHAALGDVEEGDDVPGFSAVFKKPLRLAALLDAGMNAWRVRQMKTARSLSPSVQLNPFSRTLDDAGRGISQQLSAREAAFLLAILDAGEKGLSRERAITDVWGYHRDVDSHAVETAAYRLRQKLQPLFGDQDVLTSNGGTYIWRG